MERFEMPMEGITLESVKKSFGDKVAVRDLTFSVAPGEIHGLLVQMDQGRAQP